MADPRDSLELSYKARPSSEPEAAAGGAARPFLALYFACSNTYARAYKRPDGSCYQGRCPRCGKSIDFPVGEGGTRRRMFEVRCD